MEVRAHLRDLHIAPRKVKLVADMIRGMKVADALNQLRFSTKRCAPELTQLVNSAVANAEHNYKLDTKDLYIKEIFVNAASAMKRHMPRAHGTAHVFKRHMSHISIVLSLKQSTKVEAATKKVSEKAMKEVEDKTETSEKKTAPSKKAVTKKAVAPKKVAKNSK